MVRKQKKKASEEGSWALTMADMMTLLMCFFVLLFSISTIDSAKYETVSAVLTDTMGGKTEPPKPDQGVVAEVNPTQMSLFRLQGQLAGLVAKDKDTVEMQLRPEGVSVNLKGSILFGSGSADLTPRARDLLKGLIKPILGAGYPLVIEGHTDNVPVHSGQFPSNWELSAARAAAVARLFIDQGFAPGKIKVVGLADTRPLAPNTDENGTALPENQAKNRRVTILVRPAEE